MIVTHPRWGSGRECSGASLSGAGWLIVTFASLKIGAVDGGITKRCRVVDCDECFQPKNGQAASASLSGAGWLIVTIAPIGQKYPGLRHH